MKRVIWLFCFLILLSGCGQKAPVTTSDDMGVLAVPMDVLNTSGHPIGFYFVLSSSTNPDFTIRLDPIMGRYFAFSEPVPPGDYVFDTETVYAVPTQHFSTTIHKKSRVLRPTMKVKIENGTMLIAEKKLAVVCKQNETQSYWTSWDFFNLDWNERKDYSEKLAQLENADSWHILGEWEQY